MISVVVDPVRMSYFDRASETRDELLQAPCGRKSVESYLAYELCPRLGVKLRLEIGPRAPKVLLRSVLRLDLLPSRPSKWATQRCRHGVGREGVKRGEVFPA